MSSPYIGEIRMVGFNFAPVGWAFCDGAVLPISQNEALFNLIGTTYGGDGQNTFALPNLSGRVPVHVGPGFAQGQLAGEETVTLTPTTIPGHTHLPAAVSAKGNRASPSGSVFAGSSGGTNPYSTNAGTANLNPAALANVGGSQPHENMPPFLVVNFVISLFGVFPSQT